MISPSIPTIALVTGATGSVGPSLINYLVENGYQVRILLEPESDTSLLPEGITRIIGDINDLEVVNKAVSNVDFVFHLAAILHINNPDESMIDEYKLVNVDGTRKIVDASVNADVKRVIFFSTINVYGSGQEGDVYFEHHKVDPKSIYAMTKVEAEEIVLSAKSVHDEHPLGVVMRMAAIYGPNMKGNYLRLLKGLKQGWFFPIGSGNNRRTLVFIDDVVRAAEIAARHPKAAGNVYNLTDGEVYTLKDIIFAMCAALNRKPPKIHLPVAFTRFCFGLLEDLLHILGSRAPVGRQTIDVMLENRAVNGNKIQQELGFYPQVELGEGWSKIVDKLYN